MWLRDRKRENDDFVYGYPTDRGGIEVSMLKQALSTEKWRRDRAQERIDNLLAEKCKVPDWDAFASLLDEFKSSHAALCELTAVGASTETTIYRRACKQYDQANEALIRFVFPYKPTNPDIADEAMAGEQEVD